MRLGKIHSSIGVSINAKEANSHGGQAAPIAYCTSQGMVAPSESRVAEPSPVDITEDPPASPSSTAPTSCTVFDEKFVARLLDYDSIVSERDNMQDVSLAVL